MVDFCNLQDIGFEGYPFTWSNARVGEDNIQLCLGRAFGTEQLIMVYPFYKLVHGQHYASNHLPLLIHIECSNEAFSRKMKTLFHFEEHWT